MPGPDTTTKTDDTAATVVMDRPAAAPQETALQRAESAASARVPVRMGIAPTSVEEAWRLATLVAQSDIVPKDFRGKPANVLIAMELGLEVGIPWLQAVQGTSIINGRPGFFGDIFLGVILVSAHYADHDEYYEVAVEKTVMVDNKPVKQWVFERRDGLAPEDWKRDDTAAVCTFWRRGKQNPTTRRFTVGQAKKASLIGKEGPWSNYPDRMLAMRSRAWAGRDTFPDVLKGVKSAEELLDVPEDRPAPPEIVQPRRASEAPQAAASSPVSPQQPATAGTPSSAPASAEGETEMRGLLITNTQFCKPKGAEPYYEITAKSATGGNVVLLTRDEQIYKEARSFEGTEHRVVVGAKEQAKAGEKSAKVLVLNRIGLYEGDEPAGDLFPQG